MYRLLAGSFAGCVLAVAACSGAADQDVLSNQVGATTGGTSTSSSGSTTTSGGTTSGGTTSGGTTSGGTTSGGTTSGGPTGACTQEQGDSTEKNLIRFTTAVCGTLNPPSDIQDYGVFTMPKNHGIKVQFTGAVKLTFYDPQGNPHTDVQTIANNDLGDYVLEVDYDPVGGGGKGGGNGGPLSVPWSVTITFQ